MSKLAVRFGLLLLITTIVVVPMILLRDLAIHWLLLDMKTQHSMAVTLISKPIYFSVVVWLLIWRRVTSFPRWLFIMGGLCSVLFPLAVMGLEVTDTRVGILSMAPAIGTRLMLYVFLFLFELLLTFVIAGITHRIFVSRDRSRWPTSSK